MLETFNLIMDYFPPQSFVTFGTTKKHNFRLGCLRIDEIKFHCYVSVAKSFQSAQNFRAKIWDHEDIDLQCENFKTEEEAVRWIEQRLIRIIEPVIEDQKR
jgi:hypothetical protein